MTPTDIDSAQTRRHFFRDCGVGVGSMALASLLNAESRATEAKGSATKPHFPAKAKSVIFLFMEGGPSHLDLFDRKPELNKRAGQPLPASFGKVLTPMGTGGNKLLASKRKWDRHGKSGLEISDWMPHTAKLADELCVMRACWADGLNHVGSVCQMNTGSTLAGRPCLGSWALYGLGTPNQNLPGFVVMTDAAADVAGGARNWGTGYMPATYQGTHFRSGADPILSLATPKDVGADRQRDKLGRTTPLIGRDPLHMQQPMTTQQRMGSYPQPECPLLG